nr:MAG TPA: hypothetical protein [Caudoviricetes sp.]
MDDRRLNLLAFVTSSIAAVLNIALLIAMIVRWLS